jgi:heat-inducible transcriptional repressor
MRVGLAEREQEILCEVVESYLLTGEPVASTTLARRSRTGLSSASLRSAMAELEAKGLLVQPHTSAGRVPSDAGLQLFIARLMRQSELLPGDEDRLKAMLAPPGPLEEALAQVSRVLAEVTSEVAVAVAPASQQAILQSIHFVRVSPHRVLAIVVTSGGLVDSRLLPVGRNFETVELDRISNYCTQCFAGLTIEAIRRRLIGLLAEEQARADALLADVVELGRSALASEGASPGEVFVEGAGHLLQKAVPAQLDAVQRLLAAFADKALLLSLLSEFFSAPGPQVLVGSEVSLVGGDELGLIVTSFKRSSGERGIVGVIGLKRMDYPRIIPIVDYIGHYLTGAGDETRGVG